MFDSLYSSKNQELFEKHLCNKSNHYEKYRRFLVTQRKPSCANTKLTSFTISNDEWNAKEDTGKSLKNALHILRYAKSTSQAEATSNSEKIKPVALAVIKLRRSEGIS